MNSDTIVTYGITDDQSPGECLFDRVEKKSSAGETRSPFHVHCRGQGAQSRINEFEFGPQIYSAPSTIGGGHQRRVRTGHRDMCHVTCANPLLHLRRTESHQASIERDAPEVRTS